MTSCPVVVVTGGTRGIGRRIVELLCADGYGVVFTHSGSDADAKALEDDLGDSGALVRGVRLDVTDEDAPARLFDLAESAGEVTGLVNNAGVTGRLGPAGIRVNAVSPGTIDTTIHARAGEPGRAARVAARVPLGRPGKAEEIAEAVRWLLSDRASYVNGAVLEVTGGL
ncbi:SDR family oxidoreductase [Microbispora sp. NBC_01189]|uniref:SDR family NAD(P)-dependent oxidoreductase n=1 Tax=Microbispora sp. NBC_01189 TaxID=2903583 RepID=UPI002E0E05A2|nr:SDR family oxidoreductase [Microbispora sp. NBC_01189]